MSTKNVPVLYWFYFQSRKLKGDALKQTYKYEADIPEEEKFQKYKTLENLMALCIFGR
jgi:hypothetical protein